MGKQISLCIIMHFMQKEHFKKTIEKKKGPNSVLDIHSTD